MWYKSLILLCFLSGCAIDTEILESRITDLEDRIIRLENELIEFEDYVDDSLPDLPFLDED